MANNQTRSPTILSHVQSSPQPTRPAADCLLLHIHLSVLLHLTDGVNPTARFAAYNVAYLTPSDLVVRLGSLSSCSAAFFICVFLSVSPCSADSHERGEKLGSSIGQICSASVASQPSTRLTALQQFLRSILLHAAQVERGWAVCCATNATNHTVGPMRQVASGWVFFVKCEQRPQKMTFRRRFLRNKIHSSLLMKTRAFRRFSGRGKQGLDRIL